MHYEGDCGRCGETYKLPGLTGTRHHKVIGNKICGGYPKRIYEVHDDDSELHTALVKRRVYSKQQHPLMKFRPEPPPPRRTLEDSEDSFEDKYSDLLSWWTSRRNKKV